MMPLGSSSVTQDEQRAQHEQASYGRQRTRREYGFFCVVDDDGAPAPRRSVCRGPPTATQITGFRWNCPGAKPSPGIDDGRPAAHRGAAGDGTPGHAGRQREHEQLVGLDAVAEKIAVRDFGVAKPAISAPCRASTSTTRPRQIRNPMISAMQLSANSRGAGAVGLDV